MTRYFSVDYLETVESTRTTPIRVKTAVAHARIYSSQWFDSSQWFEFAGNRDRPTRSGADPLNIVPKRSRLDGRQNFFSQRVVMSRNRLPADLKQARSIQ